MVVSRNPELLKSKVEWFYGAYNPTELHKVPKALAQPCTEEELFSSLAMKYGLDLADVEGKWERFRLEEFYRKYNPNEMEKVDVAVSMAKRDGVEAVLAKLRAKYAAGGEARIPTNAAPPPQVAPPVGPPSPNREQQRLRIAFEDFYRKYSPGDMQKVEAALARAEKEGPESVFAKLRAKYGVADESAGTMSPKAEAREAEKLPPHVSPNPSERASEASARNTEQQRLRTAFEDFYRKYSPGDMQKVEAALARAEKEGAESVFAKLRAKYGVADESAGTMSPKAEAHETEKKQPQQATQPETAQSRRALLKERFQEFYRVNCPEDISKAEAAAAMAEVEGEENVMAQLKKKYCSKSTTNSIPPSSEPQDSKTEAQLAPKVHARESPTSPTSKAPHRPAASKTAQIHKIIYEFYQKYSPSEISKVDAAVAIAEKEGIEPVLDRLRKKYVPAATTARDIGSAVTPATQPAVAPTNVPDQSSVVPKNTENAVVQHLQQENEGLRSRIYQLEESLKQSRHVDATSRSCEATLREKEIAIRALEAAFEVRIHAGQIGVSGDQAKTSPFLFDRQVEELRESLEVIELQLLEKAASLKAYETALQEKTRVLDEREKKLELQERERQEQYRTAEKHWKDLEVEYAARLATVSQREANVESAQRKFSERECALVSREETVADRQVTIRIAEKELAQKERNLQASQEGVEKEREICKALSEDVMRREAAVRAVEKSLSIARSEMQRLEDEVASRMRKLLDAEAAVKRWVSDLQRREALLSNSAAKEGASDVHLSN